MCKSEIMALAAIKKYCVECSGFSKTEAARCPAKNCPLYQYRPTLANKSKADKENVNA